MDYSVVKCNKTSRRPTHDSCIYQHVQAIETAAYKKRQNRTFITERAQRHIQSRIQYADKNHDTKTERLNH